MVTVLQVDDDPAVRELFAIFLAMGGYLPLEAGSGSECLELLKNQMPDLIILDLMMEPIDGWETLAAIKTIPAFREIPVIVVTGKQPSAEEIRRYGGDIWDYIIKPVDIEQVVAGLHTILAKNRGLVCEIAAAIKRGANPRAAEEYARYLRLVTVAHNLERRRRNRTWTENVSIEAEEKRLRMLRSELGIADSPAAEGT